MITDKFGFYEVGNRKTFSKIEAIEWADGNTEKIKWDFNNSVFSLYDWKKEPEKDVNYFYDERAIQLRNSYDYIILFYSSGFDSHNILKTFIDNKILIDEIVTIIPKKDIFSEMTYEYQNFTKLKLSKYSTELINTKITVLEYADNFLQLMGDITEDDLLYGTNNRYAPNHIIRQKLCDIMPQHRQMAENGKKVCYLYGMDKPTISYRGGKFYSTFKDVIVSNIVLPKTQANLNFEINTEFFYWAPECVPMIIKQSHLLNKYYKQMGNDIFKSTILKREDLVEFQNKNQWTNLTIYPRCKRDLGLGYFNDKFYHQNVEGIFSDTQSMENNQVYPIMGYRDAWLYTSNTEAAVKLRKITDHVRTFSTWFNSNNPKYSQIKSISNYYALS